MKINENNMIDLIINKLKKIKSYKNKIIGLMGVAFKAETDDIRNSLSIKLINKLEKMRLKVIYTDEYYLDKKIFSLKEL